MKNGQNRSLEEIRCGIEARVSNAATQQEALESLVELVTKQSFDVEILKRRLTAVESLLRAKDEILARYGTGTVTRLSAAVTIDAREALTADGFHELEYDSDGPAFRWTGPTNFTRLVVWVDRSTAIFARLETCVGGDGRNGRELALIIDGRTYPLRQGDSSTTYLSDAIPPADIGGPTEIVLHVPFLSAEGDREKTDNRIRGIRFHRLELARCND
jgi:hypothetical protein